MEALIELVNENASSEFIEQQGRFNANHFSISTEGWQSEAAYLSDLGVLTVLTFWLAL